jgi:hypothetical protein
MRAGNVDLGLPSVGFEFADAKIDELQRLWNYLDGVIGEGIAACVFFPLLAGKLELLLQ